MRLWDRWRSRTLGSSSIMAMSRSDPSIATKHIVLLELFGPRITMVTQLEQYLNKERLEF